LKTLAICVLMVCSTIALAQIDGNAKIEIAAKRKDSGGFEQDINVALLAEALAETTASGLTFYVDMPLATRQGRPDVRAFTFEFRDKDVTRRLRKAGIKKRDLRLRDFTEHLASPRQQLVGVLPLDQIIDDPALLEEVFDEAVTISMTLRANRDTTVVQGITTTLRNLTMGIVCVEGQTDNAKNYQQGRWTLVAKSSLRLPDNDLVRHD